MELGVGAERTCRVWHWDLAFRVQGLGFRVQGLGFRGLGSGVGWKTLPSVFGRSGVQVSAARGF